MAKIQLTSKEEGVLINKYFHSRLIRHNKNVIIPVTGQTGSGKSYYCLAMINNWYQKQFKRDFPIKNVCFDIKSIMDLLNSKELKRGEFIVIEEAGVLMNSLDFQNKIAKLFTFVLQSFRSMNIGLVLNLPVLSMLNKSARLLIHAHFTMVGIDFDNKTSACKPLFHQLNQTSGKSYWKYLRIKVPGSRVSRKVERISYGLPPQYMIDEYEAKKKEFVSELNADFVEELKRKQNKEDLNKAKEILTDKQKERYLLKLKGLTNKKIAEILTEKYNEEITQEAVRDSLNSAKKKGFDWKEALKWKNSLEKEVLEASNPM